MTSALESFHAHLDGRTLSEREIAELCSWIVSDPAHAEAVVEIGWLHEQLDHRMSVPRLLEQMAAIADPEAKQAIQVAVANVEAYQARVAAKNALDSPHRTHWRQLALAMGLAASVALLAWWGLGGARVNLPNDDGQLVVARPSGPIVARVTASLGAHWIDERGRVDEKTLHRDQLCRLTSGVLQLNTVDRAVVVAEAPCIFTLEGSDRIRLDAGRLVARVTGSAGLAVDTPTARVLDLGTEFGVDVDTQGATYVAVYEGRVLLQNRHESDDAPRDSREIVAGRGGNVDALGDLGWTVETLPHQREFIRPDEMAARIVAASGSEVAPQQLMYYELVRSTGLVGFQAFDRPSAGRDYTLAFDPPLRGAETIELRDDLVPTRFDNSSALAIMPGSEVFLDFDTSLRSPLARTGLVNERGLIGRSGSELWLQWRMRPSDHDKVGAHTGLSLMFGDERRTQEPLFLGCTDHSAELAVVTNVGSRTVGHLLQAAAESDVTQTWTMRIIFGDRADVVSVWLDTPADQIATTPPRVEVSTVSIAFDRLRLGVATDAAPCLFDDLRLSVSNDGLIEAAKLLDR